MVAFVQVLVVPFVLFVAAIVVESSSKHADLLRGTLDNADNLDAVLARVSGAVDLDSFTDFAKKFNRRFKNATELESRMHKFANCKHHISNATANEEGTAIHGITRFADFEPSEFRKLFTGHKSGPRHPESEKPPTASVSASVSAAEPACVDFRDKKIITSVKDQGQCGDCYAFASAAALESAYALKHKLKTPKITDYSEAEITDCSFPEGNDGCNGGNAYNAFQYVIKNGITDEKDYPFKATANHKKCHLPKKTTRLLKGAKGLKRDFSPNTPSEDDMAKYLNEYGPMYVAIDAGPLQTYESGILKPKEPKAGWNVDHAVLVVGYCKDKKSGIEYWTCKNSWGTSWGEKGYFRLAKGTNALDIQSNPVWAIMD